MENTTDSQTATAPAVACSDLLACDWQQLADWLQDNADRQKVNAALDAPLFKNGQTPILSWVATLEKWASGCRKQANGAGERAAE